MSVEDYLKNQYGTYKKLENGNYYVKKTDGTEIYIPKNFNSQTKVYAYLPGQGGPGQDASRLRSLMTNSVPEDYLTIIAPKSDDPTRILDQATKVITDNASQVQGIVVNGFSLGARQTMPTLNEYLEKHPEMGDSSAIIMTDGWVKGYYKRDDLSALKEHNVPMLYVSGAYTKMEDKKSPKVDTITKQLTNAGFNVIGVKSHDSGHGGFNADVISNEFVQFIFGDRDDIGNLNVNTRDERLRPFYEFYRYNTDTKRFDLIMKMKNTNDFSALEFVRIHNNELSPEELIIQSDNEYLQNYLGNISAKLGALNSSTFDLSVSSTTAVPALEPGIIAKLCSSVKSLSEKLNKDIINFAEVGSRFRDLDLKLDEQTEKLMNDFLAPLTSQAYDIPIKDITTFDYTFQINDILPELLDSSLDWNLLPLICPDLADISDERKAILISAFKYLGLDGRQVGLCGEVDTDCQWCANFVGSMVNKYYGVGNVIPSSYASVWKIIGDYGNDDDGLALTSDPRLGFVFSDAYTKKWLTSHNGEDNKWIDQSYIPRSGDLVVFSGPDSMRFEPTSVTSYTHIGFVVGTTKIDGTTKLMTIEGNVDDDVQVKYYDMDDPYVYGYGRIDYEDFSVLSREAIDNTVNEGIDTSISRATFASALKNLKSFNGKIITPAKPRLSAPPTAPTTSHHQTQTPESTIPSVSTSEPTPEQVVAPVEEPTKPTEPEQPSEPAPSEPTPEPTTKPEEEETPTEEEPTVEPTPSEPTIEPEIEEPTIESDEEVTPTKPTRPDPIPKPGEPKKPDPLPTPEPEPEIEKPIEETEPEIPTEEEPIIEPDESIEYDYEQPDDTGTEIIVEPEVEPEPAPIVEIPDEDDSSALKTIGIISAVGAGVGATAYAAHKVIDKNNMKDDNYYEYEKSDSKEDKKKTSFIEKEYYSEEMNNFEEEEK